MASIAMRTVPFRTPREVEAAVGRDGAAIVAHLDRHGILAYPTETIYGLGGAADEAGVGALIALKGRTPGKPFLVLVDGERMLETFGLRLDGAASILAGRHWPGPLTLVLPGGLHGLPTALQGPGGGIAVRWTSHPGMLGLLGIYGRPITSTSANRAGVPPATSAEEIVTQWSDAIGRGALVVLDGGPLGPSAPSTVVDCTGQRPRVIRPGAITVQVLRASVPDLLGDG